MNQKKLTPEEIQELRINAEKERETHAEVMKNIRATVMSPKLQMNTLMSSYNRHRRDEIMALLKAYIPKDKRYELSDEVKLFIYNHGAEFSEIRLYMMVNNHLGFTLEKCIFDDSWSPFKKMEDGKLSYPRFSPEAEVYIVKETMKRCLNALKLTDELSFLTEYTNRYKLSVPAEIALTDFLFATNGRDSVLDALASFVLGYLVAHQDITEEAQLRIIKSGNHEVIMYYITHSLKLLSAPDVLKALMDRADAEEVIAYYDRWAREG